MPHKFTIEAGVWIDERPPMTAHAEVVATDIGDAIAKLDEVEDAFEEFNALKDIEDTEEIRKNVSALRFTITRGEAVQRKRPRRRARD